MTHGGATGRTEMIKITKIIKDINKNMLLCTPLKLQHPTLWHTTVKPWVHKFILHGVFFMVILHGNKKICIYFPCVDDGHLVT